jgi:hypothetical protein
MNQLNLYKFQDEVNINQELDLIVEGLMIMVMLLILLKQNK